MNLDEAITEVTQLIAGASPTATLKVVKMSDEEARVSVEAPAAEMDKIKDAVRDRLTQWLVSEGLDVQVQVYDKDAPKGVVG